MNGERKTPKRRFKEFQNGDEWKQYKLEDVIEGLYNGQTPSRDKEDYWKGNINWLSSGELNRSTVYDSIEKITKKGQQSANLKIVPKGTFVMAITGLEAPGTRGNCAILGFDTTLNQSCMAIFPKDTMLTSEFLFQWYRKVGEDYGIRFTQGTKQQSYNAETIKDLDICLPPINEQNKISKILSNLDNISTNYQRKLEKLKALKKAYLSQMFPSEGESKPKLRFAGFNDEWKKIKLGDIGSTYTGLSGKSKEDFGHGEGKYVTYMNVFSNSVADISLTDSIEIDKKQNEVKKGDIFFTTSSETPNEVGMSSVWIGYNSNIYLNSFCFGYRPNVKLNNYYVAYMMRCDFIRKQMVLLAQGISRYNISKNKVMEIEAYFPSMKEQQRVGEYFNKINNLITLHQRKLEKLQNLKKAYLNEMFV